MRARIARLTAHHSTAERQDEGLCPTGPASAEATSSRHCWFFFARRLCCKNDLSRPHGIIDEVVKGDAPVSEPAGVPFTFRYPVEAEHLRQAGNNQLIGAPVDGKTHNRTRTRARF